MFQLQSAVYSGGGSRAAKGPLTELCTEVQILHISPFLFGLGEDI